MEDDIVSRAIPYIEAKGIRVSIIFVVDVVATIIVIMNKKTLVILTLVHYFYLQSYSHTSRERNILALANITSSIQKRMKESSNVQDVVRHCILPRASLTLVRISTLYDITQKKETYVHVANDYIDTYAYVYNCTGCGWPAFYEGIPGAITWYDMI